MQLIAAAYDALPAGWRAGRDRGAIEMRGARMFFGP